ncbi:MAG: helix-turn-helix transcriptional regulator [Alphaproteobacteria bacterium]|jgi:y4mF family transcriptional regulator|nr:helix-turn-helix transcriptional regulator [Alphaproteobacteria bacterium]
MKKIEDIKGLGIWVRQARKEQGLTQEQLAATSSVGIRFIRELEQGKETCHIGKVMQVLQMLGIEIFARKRGEVN